MGLGRHRDPAWRIETNDFQDFCGFAGTRYIGTAWNQKKRKMVYYREKDEPSIGLHPANIVGLNGVMYDLVADAGEEGGRVIAQGTLM